MSSKPAPAAAASAASADVQAMLAQLEAQNALLSRDPRAVSQLAELPREKDAQTPPADAAGDARAAARTHARSDSNTGSDAISTAEPAAPDAAQSAEENDRVAHQQVHVWAELLAGEALETLWRKKPKRLAELVLAGVPAPLRCVVWSQLAQVHTIIHPPPSASPPGSAAGGTFGGTVAVRPTTPSAAEAVVSPTSTSNESATTASDTVTDDPSATATAIPATNPSPQPQPQPLSAYAQLLLRGNDDHEKLIRRDIGRTFPDHPQFREAEGQELLFNVLSAYAAYDPDVAYCQGLPFMCAVLLMQPMPEESAFDLLVTMLHTYRLRGLFRPNMAALPLCLFQLERLLAETLPALHAHFVDLELQASTYASSWFLTLFASSMPLPVVFRIFDLFFYEGLPAIFRVALAVLSQNEAILLRQPFEGVVEILGRNGLASRYGVEGAEDELMRAVASIPPTSAKRLHKLEQDYQREKAAEAAQSSELARSKSECATLRIQNAELRAQLQQLESAYALLAKKHMDQTVVLQEYQDKLEELSQKIASTVSLSAVTLSSPSPSPHAAESSRGGDHSPSSSSGRRRLAVVAADGNDVRLSRQASSPSLHSSSHIVVETEGAPE